MPRIYRTQKEVERFLIKELLGVLGYRISSPKWTEKPDAILTLTKGRIRKRVGIEHTEYFNDTVVGTPSPRTPIDTFWRKVQASLIGRVSHRRHLTGLRASLDLNTHVLDPTNAAALAQELAGTIVDFLECHPVRRLEHRYLCSDDFESFPVLKAHVNSLWLGRWTDDLARTRRAAWTCSNITAWGVGVSLGYIKSAIRAKDRKAVKYNWRGAVETWLLIAASGDNASNDAGPLDPSVDLWDDELSRVCQSSPFDKILPWERTNCWYKWLKPEKPARQYRNPYVN